MPKDREPLPKKPVVKTEVPSNVPVRDKGTKLTLSINIDRTFKYKVPFLFFVLVLFIFATIMFAKANFSFADVFDFNRIENNVSKLYSISFILFVFLFSLCLALAAIYGFRLNSDTVLLSMVLLIIPLGIGWYMYPRYGLAFLSLSVPVWLTGFFISLQEKLNLSTLYASISKALLLFLILTVAFTFLKVQGDKDIYFDSFMLNVARLAPSLQGQLQTSVADAIENIEIDSSAISSGIAAPSGESGPVSLISRDTTAQIVAANYDDIRDLMLDGFEDSGERAYAQTKMPIYSDLPVSERNRLTDSVYNQLSVNPSGTDGDSSGGIVEAIWPQIRAAMAEQVRNKPAEDVDPESIPALKQRLFKIPIFQTFYNNFEVFMSLIVLSMISIFVWIVKILGSFLALGLTKLIT
ncbi:hypothetical protein KJ765_02365 [Candidatus Micrarchaeota archaeon]|nr:hypothetical protein [Candidatus Micrarchaeota archaeon]